MTVLETTWSLEKCRYCKDGTVGHAGNYIIICEFCDRMGLVMRERAAIRRDDAEREPPAR